MSPRPRSDKFELVERIAAVLREDPDATANTVCLRVGGRRKDVLRVVRAIRAAQPLYARSGRFPNPLRGRSGQG